MVDGLFIKSLLLSFFFKIFPEVIQDGRLFIAEPPLYRINDKKNPFVINKEDYMNRHLKEVIKEYEIGIVDKEKFDKSQLETFLQDTSNYAQDLQLLSQHYKINDRLLELILTWLGHNKNDNIQNIIDISYKNISILMREIESEFPEIYFDENDKLIKGIINGKYQSIEITERLIRKSEDLINIINDYVPFNGDKLYIKHIKTGTIQNLPLIEILKMINKFQPDIISRFKGLGENEPEDLKTTIMDPNTRSLIRVHISDIENDMKIFQMLRGNSPQDALNRKELMRNFKINRDLIDT